MNMVMLRKLFMRCVVNKLKAKVAFIAAWMLWGMNIALATPRADITEQQQRAKQQVMEQQSRVYTRVK